MRGLGATLALPFLEAMLPRGATSVPVPRRFVAINLGLGLHPPAFFPKESGPDYETTPLLRALDRFRDRFTVIEGLDHGIGGGHYTAQSSFLSSVDYRASDVARRQPTLDQVLAEEIGTATRFESLELGVELVHPHAEGGSVNRHGVWLPRIQLPKAAFRSLFVTGTKGEPYPAALLDRKQSVIDRVREQSRRFERDLGATDRERLDRYFTSIRAVEDELDRIETWSKQPVRPSPRPIEWPSQWDMLTHERLMLAVMALALEADVTRVITLIINGKDIVMKLKGVTLGYHNLSHHGMRQDKIDQLLTIEHKHTEYLAHFLGELSAAETPDGSTLLDNTVVLFGSGLGNASSHSNKNLPILIAGGGLAHKGSLKYDATNKRPLSNLYVDLQQHLGVEADRFGASTGRLGSFD